MTRIIHASLSDYPAVLVYEADYVRGYVHNGLTWSEINSHRISNDATILSARDYAARWPGLKLPGDALAA